MPSACQNVLRMSSSKTVIACTRFRAVLRTYVRDLLDGHSRGMRGHLRLFEPRVCPGGNVKRPGRRRGGV